MIEFSKHLRCPGCRAVGSFDIDDKVPRAMPGEAECSMCGYAINANPETLAFVGHCDEGFDQRWKQHPRPQAQTEKVFWDKTGWCPGDLEGKLVLDAGVGCGRFAALAEQSGAHVVGVDLSPHGLAATRENAPGAYLLQADLLDLPIADGVFDAAYSIGVLHHTPDTKKAFMEVARTVKPGGELAVWVYAKHVTEDRLFPALECLHDMTRAISPDVLHEIFARHSVRIRESYAGEWGALQQILRVSNSPDDEECISDTHDWHACKYRWWHTAEEVRGWFEEARFDILWEGGFPVSMKGKKR